MLKGSMPVFFSERKDYRMRQDLTYLVTLADFSGSMHRIRADMEGAYNAYLAEQAKLPGELRTSLYGFNAVYRLTDQMRRIKSTNVTCLYHNILAGDARPLVIAPSGDTPLYDALGQVIDSTGEFLAAIPESQRPGNVLFAVITDGEENASTRYRLEDVRQRVELQTNVYNWQFTFLGANMDAFAAAESIGICRGSTLAYNSNRGSIQAMSASLHANTTRLRKGEQFVYTDQERQSTQV
jgi:hypothetical protein